MEGGRMNHFFYYAKSKVSEKLNLPISAILGDPLVELTGKSKIRVENHKGIVKYTSDEVRLNTVLGTLVIKGKGLVMNSLITEEILLEGEI